MGTIILLVISIGLLNGIVVILFGLQTASISGQFICNELEGMTSGEFANNNISERRNLS
jgi:hypothetical protein